MSVRDFSCFDAESECDHALPLSNASVWLSHAARIRADSVLPEARSRATGTMNLAHGP